MLYYRNLRVGTLDLASASQGGLAELYAMKTVRLGRLFPDAAAAVAATRSLKAISARARVFAEEFGISVTYVATGFASWSVVPAVGEGEERVRGSAPPRAPVLLRPVTVTPGPDP